MVMKTAGFYAALLLTLLLTAGRPVFAADTIGWESLVPPLDEAQDPILLLSEEQQESLYDLWMVRERIASGSKNLEDLEKKAVDNLASGGIDADQILRELEEFLAMVEENNFRLVQDLDGKIVRIPGYVLPTEFSGDKVVEFLLVPYVGACVHTPPPPANQMVHVKVNEGFTSEGLFAPVWVTGQITTAMTTQSLSLNDGTTEVEAGYQISASDIAPYE
jgi:uncharacterized protein